MKLLDIAKFKSYKDISEMNPFDIVLIQECEQMNNMICVMKIALENLLRGMRGELNMTDDMEILTQDIILLRVPMRWKLYPTLKSLASWFLDLLCRIEQYNKWSDNLLPNSQFLIPQSIWLCGLFNPLKFLTACKQLVARKRSLPLDEMALITIVTEFKT